MQTVTSSRKYGEVNACIYCGDTKKQLTIEHIIPFSIGGRWELPKASCLDCAEKIFPFETFLARDMLRPFRARNKFKSRGNKMPKTMSFDILGDGPPQTISLSVDDHPGILLLPAMPQPWALTGVPYFVPNGFSFKLWHHPDRNGLDTLQKRFGGKRVNLGLLRHDYFCRALAKMAHALATAEYGRGTFEPTLLPVIMGEDANYQWFVGGSLEAQPATADLHTAKFEDWRVNGTTYHVCHLRLFGSLAGPRYDIVAGRAAGHNIHSALV